MCMCVPFVFLYDSLLVIIFMVCKTKLILHSFENIVEKLTSLDVDNLTYLAGCFLFSVSELKEDSQFTVLWLYKTKIFLVFLAS